jgi:hypothetical protein
MDPQPEPLIALPVRVETSATALAVGGALWIWVNEPVLSRTAQVRVLGSLAVEELEPLPVVVAGAAACGGVLLVSGSLPDGQPAVLGVADDGAVRWEARLDAPVPSFWPVPGCAPEPVAAWQEVPDEIRIAAVGPQGFAPLRHEAVGGPPLDLTVTPTGVWAIWANAEGVWAAGLGAGGSEIHHLATMVAAEVAAGTAGGRACLAWARGDAAYVAIEGSLGAPEPVDLGTAAGGRLVVVPGPRPLVWARRSAPADDGGSEWVSAFARPGSPPLVIGRPVHAAAAWGDRLAIVGTEVVRVLASPA